MHGVSRHGVLGVGLTKKVSAKMMGSKKNPINTVLVSFE